MKSNGLLLLVLLFCLPLLAQETDPNADQIQDIGFCGHELMHQAALQNPGWKNHHDQIEQRIYEHFRQHPGEIAHTENADYTLPVVVHIIHENGAENIPDATVIQGIQDLNDAFANVGYYNPNTGVDTKIQFCLATRAPEGGPTTGINRVESALTEMFMESQDLEVKDLIRWDPTQYINIWLVREICSTGSGCGVAGYAFFPSVHGLPQDGIVMEAQWFGSSQAASGVQVHEMGHYLGLYHTFQNGCLNDDCLVRGDRVCDTPPDQSTAAVPCGTSVNSCNTDTDSGFSTDQDDLIENYMDYGYFSCYSLFTQGQADRMAWHIDELRFSLLESAGCSEPCLSDLTADFQVSTGSILVGDQVLFTNTSLNTTSAEWTVDGTSFANSLDADYQFGAEGVYEICVTVGNADPNCYDTYCKNITVTCPVIPFFLSSNPAPLAGETVSFNNISANAATYSWTINGNPAGNTEDLEYIIPSAGIYEICLTADNGLCAEEFCQVLFTASTNPDDCIEATFVRIWGDPDADDEGMVIIPSGDGHLYLGGKSGSRTLIAKIDAEGMPIWQRTFQFSSHEDILSQLHVDSDNNIVGCGYGEDGNVDNLQPYVFKYDPVANAVLWVRTYSGSSRAFNILEPSPGSDYIVTFDQRESPPPGAFEDAILKELDRNTGQLTGNLNSSYNIGSSETFSNTILHNNELYTTGRYTNGAGVINMRQSLTRFDLNGNEQWTRFTHISPNGFARLYGRDMLIENNEIISTSSGDDDGGSATVTNFFLHKHSLDGEVIWSRKYEIGQFQNEWAEEVVSLPDGFLLLGYERQTPGDLFVVKTDKDGQPLWAKRYGSSNGTEGLRFTCESQLLVVGNFFYLTAWTDSYSNSRDLLLIKADTDGNLEDDCILVSDISVDVINVQDPVSFPFTLNEYANPQQAFGANASPQDGDLMIVDVEECVCVPTIGCDSTFVHIYGEVQDNERGQAIVSVPAGLGGGFLIGGGRNDAALITWIDPAGNVILSRTVNAVPTGDELITRLMFDSDDNLIAIGRTDAEAGSGNGAFAFKYNLATDNLLWLNELNLPQPSNEIYYALDELGPGGNYVIGGQVVPGLINCDAILIELDRSSGVQIHQSNLDWGSCETYSDLVVANSAIYTTGRLNYDGGGAARMRPGVTRFDLNGNQIWTKWYLEPVSSQDNARLYSNEMVDDNGLVIFGYGDPDGTSTDNVILFLFKINYNGDLLWAQQYEIPNAVTLRSTTMVSVSDGYLLAGYHTSADQDGFILKTDKLGGLQWSRKLSSPASNDIITDMLAQAGQIFLTGWMDGPSGGVANDFFLVNLNADGMVDSTNACSLFGELAVNQTPYDDPFEAQFNLEELGDIHPWFVEVNNLGTPVIPLAFECQNSCLDSCDILPEAAIVAVTAACDASLLLASIEICNNGNFDLPAGTPLTFYNGDPTSSNALTIGTFSMPQVVTAGNCITLDINIPGQPNNLYSVIVNDDGSNATPFSLDDIMGNELECDYSNNIGFFEVEYTLVPLELGNDTTVCQFGVVDLDAGPGYSVYDWSDGSNEQILTAWLPGTYSVTVTDECGVQQSDTITIAVDSTTILDLGPDTTICAGIGYAFDIPGYESYEWIPAGSLSCSDCPNPTATPGTTTTYILTATAADGCIGVDSLTIFVLPTIETMVDTAICQGDSIEIFGEFVSVAGVYTQTFSDQNGCDSTHTVNLTILENSFSSEDLSICAGETIDIFGTPTGTAGSYAMTFPAANGCDSTHTINLEVRDTFATQEFLSVCQGETVDIFGTPTGTAGVYSMTFEAMNGCDSTHTVTLDVLSTFSTEEDRFICFGEVVDIFGTPTNQAGVYMMTFTATNGCDSTHIITLAVNPEIQIEFDIMDVTCFGAANGSVTAMGIGGAGGFEYSWDTGEMGATIENLAPGLYSVTATDASECAASALVGIEQPDQIEIELMIQNVSCDELGEARANAVGGTGTITFEWSTGETGVQITGLEAGTYAVTATDENDCMVSTTFEITGTLAPTVAITIDAVPTSGDPTGGALTAVIDGGTEPYTVLWNTGSDQLSLSDLPGGQYIVQVTDANGCVALDTVNLFIAGCIGDRIWEDLNRDGCQNGGEPGFAQVLITLSGTDIFGDPVNATTTTDVLGHYSFDGLPPGDYTLSLQIPANYLVSPQAACGSAQSDNDYDADGIATLSLAEGACLTVIDGGLYDDCLNIYDPGTICCDQVLCGPGNDPAPIVPGNPPLGASNLEYMWMYSTEGGPTNNGTWLPIPNSNSASYDPGPIQETTSFVRCTRAIGCTTWLEPDPVTIKVLDDAVAQILPFDADICVGDLVYLEAFSNGPGATYFWEFGGAANPTTATTPQVSVVWSASGYPSISLTVVANGCTSHQEIQIAVSDDPNYCSGNPGQPDLDTPKPAYAGPQFQLFPNPVSHELTLSWEQVPEGILEIELQQINGQNLLYKKVDAAAGRFDTSVYHLPAGVYVLRVRMSDGETQVLRVVKQ